ncbi:omega-6 fatty acid desaturase, chloroplastic [Tanacetum coccineum]
MPSSLGASYLKWDVLPQCKAKHQRLAIPLKAKIVKAVASSVTTQFPADSAEQRKELCERYGFRQIGEPLPDNVTLKNVIDTLPKTVFEIDDVKAWKSVLISATSYALGLFMIAKSPWYLLPLAWAWTGTAVTGMSTFTMVHHTAPHIPFKSSEEWNAAQAQLSGTVHCDYPRWIEILCHDINVHIPHHVSSKIPSYNLRAAHKSLQDNWGKYMNEASWNWRLMKTILTVCHVYNEERNYISFEEVAPEISQPIAFLKRVMPDYA